MISRSTPFLDAAKIASYQQSHNQLTTLSNTLGFPNPHGYVQHYDPANLGDLRGEMIRVLEGPIWKHWCPLLVVIQDGTSIPEDWEQRLERVGALILRESQIQLIKGLEFQHVFLFISAGLHAELENGFRGSGRREYLKRRLLRIAFSRGKDSTVTFVLH
jgi:hypothetical protein